MVGTTSFAKVLFHDPARALWNQDTAASDHSFQILHTDSEQEVARWLVQHVARRDLVAIGLDTEWLGDMSVVGQPGAKSETAASYIQIAVPDAVLVVYVRELVLDAGEGASALQRLFNGASPFGKYKFIGAGSTKDTGMLRNALPGCTGPDDIVDVLSGRGQIGLETLTHPMAAEGVVKWKKNPQQQAYSRADWSRKDLSEEHIRYAAMDAWAAINCFHKLNPDVPRPKARPVNFASPSRHTPTRLPSVGRSPVQAVTGAVGQLSMGSEPTSAVTDPLPHPASKDMQGHGQRPEQDERGRAQQRARSSSRGRSKSRARSASPATHTAAPSRTPSPIESLIPLARTLVQDSGGFVTEAALSHAFPRLIRPNGYTKLTKLVDAAGLQRSGNESAWVVHAHAGSDASLPVLTIHQCTLMVQAVYRQAEAWGSGRGGLSMNLLGRVIPKSSRPIGYRKSCSKLVQAMGMRCVEREGSAGAVMIPGGKSAQLNPAEGKSSHL